MVGIRDLLHGLGHRACPGLNLVVFASDSHLDVVMLAHGRHYSWHQSVLALILVAAVRAQRLHVRLGIVVLGHCLVHVALFDISARPRRLIHRRTLRVLVIGAIVLLRSRGLLIKSPEIGLGARLRHNCTTILLVIKAELPFLLHQELLMLLTKICLCLLRCIEGVLTLLVLLLLLLVGVWVHRRESRMMGWWQLCILLCLMDKLDLLLRDHRVFFVLLHYLLFQLGQVWCLPFPIVLNPMSQPREMRLTYSRLGHLLSQKLLLPLQSLGYLLLQ